MELINFPSQITVTDQEVDCTGLSDAKKLFVINFTKHILELYHNEGKKRMCVGIAGPSGSGKSFLSVLAQELGRQIDPSIDILPVSIDAFHFPNNYLEATQKDGVALKAVKGRYDTYDVPALTTTLEEFKIGSRVQFPVYSRKLHEPIANTLSVSENPTILLVEGLWLLRSEGEWGSVESYFDRTFYIEDNEDDSRARTLKRHIIGGRSADEANRHYDESDAKNRELVTPTKSNADEIIVWPA